MSSVQRYLGLPTAYREYLVGVRWSTEDATLILDDGSLFAFHEEVAQFLEGYDREGAPLHFAHVLHLLRLLRGPQSDPEARRLCSLYGLGGCAPRNAGAFCAALCRGVPCHPNPPSAADVCERLREVSYLGADQFAPQPPLGPAAFEREVLAAAAKYSDDEVLSWFRHGRGPVRKAGEALAREAPRPRTLDGALAELLERPRLAAARGFVEQLVGALTLPPRRLAPEDLPVGGYSDVTTHGRLEQLLPSQFALDADDFIRRMAERELLYFRREDPPSRARHDLIVLLDQGVRAWGDVRLVLSAAVLALGRNAARRGVPFFVATTANDGDIVDPLSRDSEQLGELVEASDLSASPAAALERVLRWPAAEGCDVVLLTHPRSLAEPDVLTAARGAAADTRLFALALDGKGEAELSELRRGAPVSLRRFRVEFKAAPVPVSSIKDSQAAPRWSGDVESIGYPFRFSVGASGAHSFKFDHAGRWLLVAGEGMLYLWDVSAGTMEILPRAVAGGAPLWWTFGMEGVAGGFVQLGGGRNGPAVAHFDLSRRRCVCHSFPPEEKQWLSLASSPRHHVAAILKKGLIAYAFDLSTGSLYPAVAPDLPQAILAFYQEYRDQGYHTQRLGVSLESGASPPLETRRCEVNANTGELRVQGVYPAWKSFVLREDGRPALRGHTPFDARLAGDTLALLTRPAPADSLLTLHVFRGPEGQLLSQFPMDRRWPAYELSQDGTLLARSVDSARVAVHRPDLGAAPILVTTAGGFSVPEVRLGDECLTMKTGKRNHHVLRWDGGTLRGCRAHGDPGREFDLTPAGPVDSLPHEVAHDPARFVAQVKRRVNVLVDRFGEVLVFDRHDRLVCMFFAFRTARAGWMPDGTRFGPATLTGGPQTPDAPEKFGRALAAACDGG